MRTAATLAIAVVLSVLPEGSAAPAAPEPDSTMERCAKLLPQGKRYTFGVTGTIDYTGPNPVVHGELSVANEANDDLTLRASPFAQCFARLVR